MNTIFKKDHVLIIGEVAQAHDGSLGTAHAYIDVIADAGADAVKFQTHIAQYESTQQEPWRVRFSYEDDTRYDYWKRMEFTPLQWAGLKAHAEERGLLFMSSPFSMEAAELLDKIGMRVWKIASGEVFDPWLMEYAIASQKPIIFSSGMSSMSQIDAYASTLKANDVAFALMQCTSKYPSQPEDIGLNVIDTLRKAYDAPVGLSDHSGEIFPSLAAVSIGATLIEVHVCMNKDDFGPDVKASLTPLEFQTMVRGVRYISHALNSPVDKNAMADSLMEMNRIFSKSVRARRPIKEGEILSKENLALKKPGNGIPASDVVHVLGTRATRDYQMDEAIALEEQ